MIRIYKLKYTDRETAITNLIAKGVYTTELEYCNGIQAVVEIGLITLIDGTYDSEGNILAEPIFADGYHYDVMSENEIIFENEIQVNNPKHMFAGY